MKQLITSCILACMLSTCLAQTSILVSGKVIDGDTNKPINYATISIQDESIGTITNAEGTFELSLASKFKDDTVIISHLGFQPIKWIAEELQQQTIILEASPVELDEITVRTDRVNGMQIFREAFDRLQDNFSQEPHQMMAFFRQASLEGDQYVLLVEAALDIYDEKYKLQKKFNLKENIVVRQVRSSNNYFQYENLNFFDGANPIKLLLNWNYTRYENAYAMARKDYQLDSVIYSNDQLVYVISSSYADSKLENRFTLHIDAETYAFVKIKNENKAKGEEVLGVSPLLADRSKLVGMTRSSQEYTFRTYDGKVYLQNCFSSNTAAIIDKKSGTVERIVSDENLLVVSEIITDGKMPKAKIMDPNSNIKDQVSQYDASFWEDFQQVRLVPLTTKQKADLERETPLQKQFLENSDAP